MSLGVVDHKRKISFGSIAGHHVLHCTKSCPRGRSNFHHSGREKAGGQQEGKRRKEKVAGQGGETGEKNRGVKQGSQTGESNRGVKQGSQTGESNRGVKQGSQTGESKQGRSNRGGVTGEE